MTPTCVRCGRPTPDGYADVHCTERARAQLAEIADLTPAARDVAYGLSATQSGAGASGKPGSRIPLNLAAAAKLDGLANALGSWVRHVVEERGAYPNRTPPGSDVIAPSARFLAAHLEWMRHRAEADEFLTDIEACARVVRGVVRGPVEQRYLGPCGAHLLAVVIPEDPVLGISAEYETRICDGDIYGRPGAEKGRCRTCGGEVAQDERRQWLDDEVRQHAFRAVRIAEAYGVRVNTIRVWATRGHLKSYYRTDRGIVADWVDPPDGEARERLHYVGDVLDLAAADAARREGERAKRARRAAARETAEMGA